VRCPDCAAEISPLRDVCPHCGASTDRVFDDLDRRAERSPDELQHNRKVVLAVGAGVLVLLAATGKIHPFGHVGGFTRHVRIESRSEPAQPVTIGAAQLFEAYHSDSQAADRRYGDREMVVTGQFVRTVPDGYGSIDMRLKTDHPDLPLGIDLDRASVDAATKLEPGQTVTVSCRRVAGSGDDPWLQDCVIQPPAAGEPSPSAAPAPPAAPTPPEER